MSLKRQDIQGLRAIGAILVATFHIFELGVSGGVDIFLTISGFFLWFAAVKLIECNREYLNHYKGFFIRTVPQALLVIVVVLVISFVLVSPVEWSTILRDAALSAVFLQNYRLIEISHDYLARGEGLGLFQHYWAVSVIAQVYLIFPALSLLAALVSKCTNSDKKIALASIIALASVISFVWFVYLIFFTEGLVHYETLARFWQFGAGSLVAWRGGTVLAETRATNRALKDLMSWVGLIAVLLCGFLVGNLFPGFASIWPTLGAILILSFSSDLMSDSRNAGYFLSNKLFVWFGSVAFGIYLWHWPIYSIYFRYVPFQSPLSAGLIILTATGLAVLGMRFISQFGKFFEFVVGAHDRIWVVSLTLIVGVFFICKGLDRLVRSNNQLINSSTHILSGNPLSLNKIRRDLPESYKNNCHQSGARDDVSKCSFGNKDSEIVILLIGGSHSAQWLPPLVKIAQREEFHLISITKSGCHFYDPTHPSTQVFRSKSCRTWNTHVIELIAKKKPTAVITLANTRRDEEPEGIRIAIATLIQNGIAVVALRDTPYMPIDPPTCATHFKIMGFPKCQIPRTELLDEEKYAATTSALSDLGAISVDMNDKICPGWHCNSVDGHTIMWRDRHHLTATYAETLADELWERINFKLLKPFETSRIKSKSSNPTSIANE